VSKISSSSSSNNSDFLEVFLVIDVGAVEVLGDGVGFVTFEGGLSSGFPLDFRLFSVPKISSLLFFWNRLINYYFLKKEE